MGRILLPHINSEEQSHGYVICLYIGLLFHRHNVRLYVKYPLGWFRFDIQLMVFG